MRVIAGAWRGRPLLAPKGEATRPTSDRVREAVFSILGDLSGATVLDAFAGTGALGIEALSRGAQSAVFVESSRRAAITLGRNLESLGAGERARTLVLPFERAVEVLGREERKFDLIFVDPPYVLVASPAFAAALSRAVAGGLLGPFEQGGRLVLEHAARDAAPAVEGLVSTDARRYGDTEVTFYVR